MPPMYDVYVYKLTNGKYLLYPALICNDNCEHDESYKECAFLYNDFLRNTKIESLEKIKTNIEAWQIDGLVHLYMHLFGIENVRGGQYSATILSDETKEAISQSIKYFTDGLDEDRGQIEKYYTYANTIVFDYDSIDSQYVAYKNLEQRRDNYKVNRNLLNELDWLKRIIETPVERFFDVKERYYELIDNLRAIYKKYLQTFEDTAPKIASVYCVYQPFFVENPMVGELVESQLSNPITFLDSRVIFSERSKYRLDFCPKDQLFLDIFSMMIYTFINREDEIIFDMSQIDIQRIEALRKIREIDLSKMVVQ
jgi:uncharacterized protein (UPF0305 family)